MARNAGRDVGVDGYFVELEGDLRFFLRTSALGSERVNGWYLNLTSFVPSGKICQILTCS